MVAAPLDRGPVPVTAGRLVVVVLVVLPLAALLGRADVEELDGAEVIDGLADPVAGRTEEDGGAAAGFLTGVAAVRAAVTALAPAVLEAEETGGLLVVVAGRPAAPGAALPAGLPESPRAAAVLAVVGATDRRGPPGLVTVAEVATGRAEPMVDPTALGRRTAPGLEVEAVDERTLAVG